MRLRLAAILLGLGALAGPAAPALAQQGETNILDKAVTVADPKAYRVDGIQGKPDVHSVKNPEFPRALRVDVPGKGPNPWSIAVAVPINKPIKAGDQLVLAIWARLEKGENGATSATLPYNAVQLAHDPYTALFSGPMTIGPEWQVLEVAKGKANANYAAGDLNVSIHLATAKQVVELGPVFLLDMGQ